MVSDVNLHPYTTGHDVLSFYLALTADYTQVQVGSTTDQFHFSQNYTFSKTLVLLS